MEHDEFESRYSKLIAKAWADEAFKKRFLANPAAVLKEEGLEVPPDVQEVKVVEGTDRLLYLVLPPKPSEELSEEDLNALAAAGPYTWCHWCKVEEGPRRA